MRNRLTMRPKSRIIDGATSVVCSVNRMRYLMIAGTAMLFFGTALPASAEIGDDIPVKCDAYQGVVGVIDEPVGQARGLGNLWQIVLIVVGAGFMLVAGIPKLRRMILPNAAWAAGAGIIGAAIMVIGLAIGGEPSCEVKPAGG